MFRKAKFLTAGLLLACLASYAQKVTFAGKTDKKFDGNKVILYNRATGDHDSAVVKDGRFELTVTFKDPTIYMFYSQFEQKTKGGYSPFGIMVTAPGTIKIKANIESFTESKISGSKEDELYRDFLTKSNKAQGKIMDELYQKYGKEFVLNRNPDTSAVRYKEMLQDYYTLNDANQKVQSENLKSFLQSHPESFASVYFLDVYARTLELTEAENLYASLSPKYKDTRYGQSIVKGIEARKITAVGKIAPDFTQPDTLNRAVKLSDFRGKYVLVDFWASWCGPCRAENPNLVKTFNRYKGKGFTVLGVSLDQAGKKDAWLDAIHKDGLTWTQVSDLKFWDNEAAVLYGIKAVPSNLLLDKEGKIVAKDLRGEELNKKLLELLGE